MVEPQPNAARGRDQVVRLALVGLISLVPLIGYTNILGWMLHIADDSYDGGTIPRRVWCAGRGLKPTVTLIAIAFVAWAIVYGLVSVLPVSVNARLWFLVVLLGAIQLLLSMSAPTIALLVDSSGLRAALDPRTVISVMRRDRVLTASLLTTIAPLGAIACFFGAALTLPLAYLAVGRALARSRL